MIALKRARAEAGRASPTPTLIAVQEAPDVAPVAADATLEHEPLPTEAPHEVVSAYPAEMVDAMCNQGYEWDCATALRICWLEMGQRYQPQAVNPVPIWLSGENHATGMCQLLLPLHSGYFNPGDPLDPYDNARAAYGLWRDSGGTFCKHWFYWC